MRDKLFTIYMFFHTVSYNLNRLSKRFKPGDIIYLEGNPSVKYLIICVDYHITKHSTVKVSEFPRLNKGIWYSDLWFRISEPGKLTKLERIIYSVD